MIDYSVHSDGCVIKVLVVPRASRSEVVGQHNGTLKVRLSAPPVDGAANEQLVRVLAKWFDVSRSSIAIVSGSTARQKQVKVRLSEVQLNQALNKLSV